MRRVRSHPAGSRFRRGFRCSKPSWPQSRSAGHPAIFVSANASLVGRRLEKRRDADSGPRAEDRGPGHRPSALALALHPSQRRRADGRIESAAAAADHPAKRHRHAVHRKGGDVRPRHRTEQPHHASALRSGRGKPPTRSVFLDHLHSPFGVVLVGDDLYVANTDAIVRYPYHDGDLTISGNGVTLTPLPGGPIDHHWTKSLTAVGTARCLSRRRLQQQHHRERHRSEEIGWIARADVGVSRAAFATRT